jgi:hypothetical protein
MSVVVRPPVDPAGAGPDEGPLDERLRAFFRAELPDPWPAFTPPRPSAAPPSRHLGGRLGGSGRRSRYALAASIALLLLGSLALAGALKFGVPEPASEGLGAAARRPAPPAVPAGPVLPR